jgi:hypothetical protein
MKALIARVAGPAIGLGLFAMALWALHQALADYRYQDVTAYLGRLPLLNLATALAATALSYLVTTGYDWLALRYIRRPLPWRQVWLRRIAQLCLQQFGRAIGVDLQLTALPFVFELGPDNGGNRQNRHVHHAHLMAGHSDHRWRDPGIEPAGFGYDSLIWFWIAAGWVCCC